MVAPLCTEYLRPWGEQNPAELSVKWWPLPVLLDLRDQNFCLHQNLGVCLRQGGRGWGQPGGHPRHRATVDQRARLLN